MTLEKWDELVNKDKEDGVWNASPIKSYLDPLVLDPEEQKKLQAATPDPIWGYGYNVFVYRTSTDPSNVRNTQWGDKSGQSFRPLRRSTVTYAATRCMAAAAYDWHLDSSPGNPKRAYGRVSKGRDQTRIDPDDRAQMLFYDGHIEMVSPERYDMAIDKPDLLQNPPTTP